MLKGIHVTIVVELFVGILIFFSFTAYVLKSKSLGNSGESVKDIVIPMLELVPKTSFIFPWTFITGAFTDVNIIQFLIGAANIFFGTAYTEKQWNLEENVDGIQFFSAGFSETITYLLVSAFFTNLFTCLIKVIVATASSSYDPLVPVNHGSFVFLMPFLVVLKQYSPEHQVKFLNLRVKQIPFIVLVLSLFISIVLQKLTPFLPIWNSFLVSWTYLRFYQRLNVINDVLPDNTKNSIQGDASDTFNFMQFFPAPLHKYLKPLCRIFYHLLILFGLIKGFNDDERESGNLRSIRRINKTSQSRDIAERRRQVALKVLEERLGNDEPQSPEDQAVDNHKTEETTKTEFSVAQSV
ncbi:hypothetical protein LJB42_004334 [Komagataella kurtzmanii]|nr:hypothetical protein LJB42_004334 [Komagataella kurtzmanii]